MAVMQEIVQFLLISLLDNDLCFSTSDNIQQPTTLSSHILATPTTHLNYPLHLAPTHTPQPHIPELCVETEKFSFQGEKRKNQPTSKTCLLLGKNENMAEPCCKTRWLGGHVKPFAQKFVLKEQNCKKGLQFGYLKPFICGKVSS